MKRLNIAFIAMFLLVLAAGTTLAQKKTTKKPTVKKPASATKVISPLAVRTAREKVDNQLANVSLFVDKFGPIASALETLDAAYAQKAPTPARLSAHETNKQNVIQTIRNLRDGLAALESEFRTKAEIKKYLPTIEGITDLAARAEDSAIAGQFVAAKDPLREVAKKLTDTLVAMPRT